MPDKIRKNLQERYNRLKNALKKVLSPTKGNLIPQLILQPYKNRQQSGNITPRHVRLRV